MGGVRDLEVQGVIEVGVGVEVLANVDATLALDLEVRVTPVPDLHTTTILHHRDLVLLPPPIHEDQVHPNQHRPNLTLRIFHDSKTPIPKLRPTHSRTTNNANTSCNNHHLPLPLHNSHPSTLHPSHQI